MGNTTSEYFGKEQKTLQLFFLEEALKEKGIDPEKTIIDFNHIKGLDYINDAQYNLIFPRRILNHINQLSKTKELDYYFKGNTSNRKWIKKYSNKPKSYVINSNIGRDPNTKYTIDVDYFNKLSKTKFALCPTGAVKWSYRFFESIMCYCIPILENDDDLFCKDYFCLYDTDPVHEYSEEKAHENYIRLLNRHFLN